MVNKIAKIVRMITVAPVMALIMLLTLYISNPKLFGRVADLILSILFLVIFPLLAYPLQPFIKHYKDKGRDGQRTLAMVFAVTGYVAGCLSALIMRAPKTVLIIYLSYLLSGALIFLINKLLRFKVSGHACGVTGPFAILICFGQMGGLIGIPMLAVVCWASLYMKRHTVSQLIGGAVIPVVALSFILCISLVI